MRIFPIFLACSMVLSGTPVMAQEEFGSGVEEIQQDNTNGAEEFLADFSMEDSEFTAEDETESFQSGEEFQDHEDFQNGEESISEEIRYIKGRPLTEEEKEEQLAPIKELTPLDPGIQVDSDLESVYSAYGERAASYPETYDARQLGVVTAAKNQHPFGTCWAFGQASLLETSLLSQGKGEYDLSEEHLSYFFSHRENDPLGNTTGDQNIVNGDYHEIGGNDYLASIFLSGWSGMTTEDDVPFPTDETHTKDLTQPVGSDKAYHAAAYLKNAYFSGYSVNRMKRMITQNQSVSVMFYMGTSYYNADTGGYSDLTTRSGKRINHIVTIVGWDDNYSKDNFLSKSKVTADGAWIAKNSWGSDWGDEGYFYLSYQDPNISNLVAAEASAVEDQQYKNNYFYDGSSAVTTVQITTGESVAAIYIAEAGKGKQESLGEINVTSFTDNSSYAIQIYTGVTDSQNPESGKAAYAQPYEFTQSIAGVQTIEIQEVTLFPGEKYAIVIRNNGSKTIKFGVEASAQYNNADGSTWFESQADIQEGQTFYKEAGDQGAWHDTKEENWSARIKAHTRTLDTYGTIKQPSFQVKAEQDSNTVSWKKVSHAAGYNIYRRPGKGGKWSKIASVSGSVLKYKDMKITPAQSYRYTVRAWYKAGGKTYLSSYTTGEVIKAVPAKQTITSVKKESKGIRIRWKAQKNCDGYRIYRKIKGGTYQSIKVISQGTAATYLDKTAKKGVSYYYAVRAYVKEPYGRSYSGYKSSSAVKR